MGAACSCCGHCLSEGSQPQCVCARSSPSFYSGCGARSLDILFVRLGSRGVLVFSDFVLCQAYGSCPACSRQGLPYIFVAVEHECLLCYRRKIVCREPVTRPKTWEQGLSTRGLTGRPRDMVQEALDTMGFFECPNLRRGLLREYRFLPWSLRRDWCDAAVGHTVFRDKQGRLFGRRPGPAPMPDGPTRSCRPLDTEYETGPVKGRKRKAEVGNPEDLLKRARREESKKNKGKGKKKVTSGPSEKVVDSGTAQNPPSVTFIGEDISVEEAHLIDAAIASSLPTNRVESMLRTQSAGAGPSNLREHFEGTREPQQARPFTGFSPTVNEE